MRIKTKDLTGAALDWAVAKADKREMLPIRQWITFAELTDYKPTVSWALTGPLRDKYKLDVMDFSKDVEPFISASYEKYNGLHSVEGPTALIAICRAVVACEIGDEVEVPDELV